VDADPHYVAGLYAVGLNLLEQLRSLGYIGGKQ